MDDTRKTWNVNHKLLRKLLKSECTFDEAIGIFTQLHATVHCSKASGTNGVTLEDELWDAMDEPVFKTSQNKKGRTVAYGMWHSTRIEDITMNILIAGDEQVLDRDNWLERINSSIYDTGNAMNANEILDFSQKINMQAIKDYRKTVGLNTRKLAQSLSYHDLKRKPSKASLQRLIEVGAVANDPAALWLIDYWKKKTVAGLILMPLTRHLLVHINESLAAKRKGMMNNQR